MRIALPSTSVSAEATLTLRQSQHALANDVVLDFAGAARDCQGARRQHPVVPTAAVERVRCAVLELAVRPEQLEREFRHLEIEIARTELADRTLRTRRQPFEPARQLAQIAVAQRGRLAREARNFLPHTGIVPGAGAIARDPL